MGSRILCGAAGGLLGSLAGQVAVRLAHQWTGDANIWFQGPHGPPFFDLALNTSIYYACLGAALGIGGTGWRRGLGLGFASSFLIFIVPMALGTRIFSWGETPAKTDTLAWVYLILGAYLAMNAAAILILARYSRRPFSWRRSLGAVLGSIAAVLSQKLLLQFVPALSRQAMTLNYLPPWPVLLMGFLWGLLIALGAAVADRTTA